MISKLIILESEKEYMNTVQIKRKFLLSAHIGKVINLNIFLLYGTPWFLILDFLNLKSWKSTRAYVASQTM